MGHRLFRRVVAAQGVVNVAPGERGQASDRAPDASSHLARDVGLGLVLLLAVFIALAAIRSADPSLYYQFTRRTAPPFTDPLLAVVASACLMSGEAVAVWLTLTWGRAPVLARRLFWCFALLLWPALGSLLPRMHQPPYYYVHELWIFTLALLALLGAAAAVGGSWYSGAPHDDA